MGTDGRPERTSASVAPRRGGESGGRAMRPAGALRADEVARIIRLLEETELTMKEIAVRMHCSHGAIGAINRKHSVRDYRNRRSTWMVKSSKLDLPASSSE